jgi:hypothetical protein
VFFVEEWHLGFYDLVRYYLVMSNCNGSEGADLEHNVPIVKFLVEVLFELLPWCLLRSKLEISTVEAFLVRKSCLVGCKYHSALCR